MRLDFSRTERKKSSVREKVKSRTNNVSRNNNVFERLNDFGKTRCEEPTKSQMQSKQLPPRVYWKILLLIICKWKKYKDHWRLVFAGVLLSIEQEQ
jgi:hypothetical protein